MSKSHHDVGIAFGQHKNAIGSRMSTINTQPVTAHQDDMHIHHNKVFYQVQHGVSYRTVIARIVRNVHTKTNELWITPMYYSSSTQRHKGYLRTGFRRANPVGLDNTDPDINIFYTHATAEGVNRNDPRFVHSVINAINNTLPDIDKPRLREATRRGTIASCINSANIAMRNFTHNIPLDHVDADTYYDLQATMGFLHSLSINPDIDAVRAAVRGHIALNTLDTQEN